MTDPIDDLQRRLERLAPPIDVDDALAAVHVASRRRHARQRGVVAAAMVLVVLVLVSAVAVAGRTPDASDVVASDPDPAHPEPDRAATSVPRVAGTTIVADAPGTTQAVTETTATAPTSPPSTLAPPTAVPEGEPVPDTDTVPAPPFEEPANGPSARPEDIEVVVTLERSTVPIGERARFRVDVTNRSADPARFASGGCGPIEAEVAWPSGPSGPRVDGWSGAGSLAAFVAGHDVAPHSWPTSAQVGSGVSICTADLRTDLLESGATVSRSYVWDGVPAAGQAGTPTPASVTAGVDVFPTGTTGFGDSVRRTATATIAFTDDPRAHVSPSAFVTGVEADPIVQQWLRDNPPSTPSGYLVSLGFANGGFELWIDSRALRLRVRGEIATGAITDIRSVWSVFAPSDDPDAYGNDPREVIYYRR